jgi:hypothetical protein
MPTALEAAIDLAFVEDDEEGRLRNTRAVVVVKDGELIAERYGDGFDADTPLLGWSMTKASRARSSGGWWGGALAVEDDGLLGRAGATTNGPRSRSSTCSR